MKLRRHCLKCIILSIVTAGLFSGCHHVSNRECASKHDQHLAMPISPGAPQVTVVGHAAPREALAALQTLVDEIHTGLSGFGGLRVMESPPIMCHSVCGDGQQCVAASRQNDSEIQHAEFTTGQLELHDPGEVLSPASTDFGSAEQLEVRVVITEFLPYRPMRLTATISVHNVITGQELTAIQGTWHGTEECEPLADSNCSLQRSLKRPDCRIASETQNLITLSPHLFLQQVAAEVVIAIHGVCQTSGCVIIGEAR